MSDLDATVAQLRARLARYPPGRFPIQHATARFHLGTLLADAGATAAARHELLTAAALFEARQPVEHAKAVNQLGVVARQDGELRTAVGAFEGAAATFERHGQAADAAAARFNLGLVLRDAGERDRASAVFRDAQRRFEQLGERAAAVAARRELGTTLLTTGAVAAAIETLTVACEGARELGDANGTGAAANALGLAHLAAGGPDAAVAAFEQALAAHPRTVRPAEHAMARANLALAHEQAGRPAHARLAGRHALAIPEAPTPVRAQARDVLDRLGEPRGDVLVVLDAAPSERWRAVLTEEVLRLSTAEQAERSAEAAAWVQGVCERRERSVDLCEAWLGALLEVPPAAFDAVVEASVAAAAARPPDERERYGEAVARATARFHAPQLLRLEAAFRTAAARRAVAWP